MTYFCIFTVAKKESKCYAFVLIVANETEITISKQRTIWEIGCYIWYDNEKILNSEILNLHWLILDETNIGSRKRECPKAFPCVLYFVSYNP